MNNSRIIIPYFYNSKLVYWVSRDITNKSSKRYLYPPTKEWKNKKSDLLYNIDYCDKDNLLICEGQFNALIVDGIAIGGAEVSQRQLKTIIELKPEKVTLALDQDLPGKNATVKVSKILHKYFKDLYYIDGPLDERDFADMGEIESRKFINKYSKQYSASNIMNTEINFKLNKD